VRTVYSELRGRMVDAGIVDRRIFKGTAPDDAGFPYIELDETSPAEPRREGMVERTFTAAIYQTRGITYDPTLVLVARGLFDRTRWDYWQDDAQTQRRRIITRTPSNEVEDRPDDGLRFDSLTITVLVASDQP
jgi:hypothetical protein